MDKTQHAILRFAKYKGPEISRIEAHNERTKETYASNPDVDTARSKQNFHLVTPERRYRAEAERQITQAGCRTRSDSVRVVEVLFTASHDFFKGKSKGEIRAFFEECMAFLAQRQAPATYLSAVVHMDEKTPHMHLSFVPLTADGRLSAKEIVGNRQKLTQWQDAFWEHMVKKYPDLERGESASKTGRTHIPPRIFKQATHLNRQLDKILQLLADTNVWNAKKRAAQLETALRKFFPEMEDFLTQTKKYEKAIQGLSAEKERLKQELDQSKETQRKQKMNEYRLEADYANLLRKLERIPPELRRQFDTSRQQKER
ncbi:plasmid recombination protein [Gemmiger formicilis]|uniref:MobV family relaxase n=1 Tax=Gemmiger formicilis TaxID=745368 RepID=UPI001958CA0C|nr:MobV family relaxase [Gemmiger formicilis]MBM6717091.1 plasmid recombination protein [Gemmiger formicilis]